MQSVSVRHRSYAVATLKMMESCCWRLSYGIVARNQNAPNASCKVQYHIDYSRRGGLPSNPCDKPEGQALPAFIYDPLLALPPILAVSLFTSDIDLIRNDDAVGLALVQVL
jgi:hypothetical protein